MPAPLLIVLASLLFSLMALCVKLAAVRYGAGEIVFYRGLLGTAITAALLKARGGSLRSPVPRMHLQRSACGVAALCLWFFTLGRLPLATAMTLNYMSSIWMAAFMVAAALFAGGARVERRLVVAILAGFCGVALILQPTIARDELGWGLLGLASGLLSAFAYMQVSALGRAGEPELRVVFYFSLGSVVAGSVLMAAGGGPSRHDAHGLALLLAIGVLASMAQLSMTRAYTIGQPLVNASLQYLAILFSFVFGIWLFGDAVTAGSVAGMLLIVGAGIAATVQGLRGHTAEARAAARA